MSQIGWFQFGLKKTNLWNYHLESQFKRQIEDQDLRDLRFTRNKIPKEPPHLPEVSPHPGKSLPQTHQKKHAWISKNHKESMWKTVKLCSESILGEVTYRGEIILTTKRAPTGAAAQPSDDRCSRVRSSWIALSFFFLFFIDVTHRCIPWIQWEMEVPFLDNLSDFGAWI